MDDERSSPAIGLAVGEDPELIARAVGAVDAQGIGLIDVTVRRPSLDDVFLTMTGRPPTTPAGDAEAQATP